MPHCANTSDYLLAEAAPDDVALVEAGRRYTVVVNDVYGDIAAAVIHAVPYVDYVHLIRTADGWRIANALWCPA